MAAMGGALSMTEPAYEKAPHAPHDGLTANAPGGLREVATLMFRLGWTAFGGPAGILYRLLA